MKATSTMSAVEQWQWFLSLRRGAWGFWGQQAATEGLKHGTYYVYDHYGCRCNPCRDAGSANSRRQTRRETELARSWKRERN